jgi:very-short-patch-repair endonuclease
MKKYTPYPVWRKIVDGWIAIFFPVKSEKDFIALMGWWWFFFNGFKHQYHIPPYRPDFVQPKYKLIIEIEGRGKYRSGDIVRDQMYSESQQYRHAMLVKKGYEILYVQYEDFNPDSNRSNPLKVRREVKKWVRSMVWKRRARSLWRRR